MTTTQTTATQDTPQDVTDADLTASDVVPDPAGREAAKYRRQLRDTEAARDQLQATLDQLQTDHDTQLATLEEAHRVALDQVTTQLANVQRERVLELIEAPFDSLYDPRGSWQIVHPELLTLVVGFDPASAVREDGTIDPQVVEDARTAMFRGGNLNMFRRVGPTSERVRDLVASEEAKYARTLPDATTPKSDPDVMFKALRHLATRPQRDAD